MSMRRTTNKKPSGKSDKGFVVLGISIYLVSLLFLSLYGGEYVDYAEATMAMFGMCIGTIFIIVGFGGYYSDKQR